MKQIEYETKILEISTKEIKQKLSHLGAVFIGESKFQRYVYDFNPINKNKWIRLRTDGRKTFLTIKEIVSEKIEGTSEIEIEVSDFHTTHLLLKELGYSEKSYQENKRESYILNSVQVEIDSWPLIPPYLEIEGKSKNEVLKIVKQLGYKQDDITSINTKKVYANYGINLELKKHLTF